MRPPPVARNACGPLGRRRARPGASACVDTAAGADQQDVWSAADERIRVLEPGSGFLYDLALHARLDGSPGEVYDVLRDPDSHEIFRGIRATLHRATLEENKARTRRRLLVRHRALTRFLWLSVTFETELEVTEDDVARTIQFRNARADGFMRKFEGTWQVQPFCQSALDSLGRPGEQRPPHASAHGWPSPLAAIQQRLHPSGSAGGGASDSALVTLEQRLAPRVRPPGPVAHIVRGLCARVLQNMVADLRAEVARRQQQQQQQQSLAGGHAPAQLGGSSRGKQPRAPRPSLPVASISSSAAWLATGSCGGSEAARSHGALAQPSCVVISEGADAAPSSSSSSSRWGWDLLAAAQPAPWHVTIGL